MKTKITKYKKLRRRIVKLEKQKSTLIQLLIMELGGLKAEYFLEVKGIK